MNRYLMFQLVLAIGLLAGCNADKPEASSEAAPPDVDLRVKSALNRIAYVPPQCFTKTQDASGGATHNPCYACHADAREPNYLDQPDLQMSYAFPQTVAGHGAINAWRNLFKDRGAELTKQSDDEIRRYVTEDNYADRDGKPLLPVKLASLPANWDADGDGKWSGYVPDAAFRFDAEGFDRWADGRESGWRALAYYPFPGAFLPTNGAFDDVLIRLPAEFRRDRVGKEDHNVYRLNLAILEALIVGADVAVPATDEAQYGVDLDGDGKLAVAARVRYLWPATKTRAMHWVGAAGEAQRAGRLPLSAGLFPQGTEFLHSVRYLALDDAGRVASAPRMKELRYTRKTAWLSYADLQTYAIAEGKEDALNPDRPALFGGDAEHGLDNNTGWVYQGFIEDARGQLRPQGYEETLYCMGCHGRISPTVDSSFAFARKLPGEAGWAHSLDLHGKPIPDPKRADGKPEYATYLANNRSGDEFRTNVEVLKRFFDDKGQPRPEAQQALARDISSLLLPSPQRALILDKLYRSIVQEQSFTLGRDPVSAANATVHREIEADAPTGIEQAQPMPPLARRS